MEVELYKEICKIENLLSSWTKVKEKGSAGGIDKVTIETFEAELENNIKELSEQLTSYHYIPEPYQEIMIPKDNNEFRLLSLPTIKDKIVQQAIKDLIEPILEKEFLNVSYAYRQNKGPIKAIARVSHLINNEKREWVTICDIDNYFDSIHHDLLFSMLSERIKDEKILLLIRLWVKMGKVDVKMRWKDSTRGIPQGNILSPLLSNLYLHPFDQTMVDRKFGYVRYADDFIILSRSEGEAYRALKDTKWFFEKKLKLNLNPEYYVKNINEGFQFLGIFFKDSEITITKEKTDELKEKINNAIDIKKDGSLRHLTDTIEGIRSYYGKIISQGILEELDEWMKECLKKHLNSAYQDGLFDKKEEIETLLSSINFLSQKQQLFAKRAIKGIVAYCHKKRDKGSGSDFTKTIKKDPIKKKKREYQKLESEGFELLVTTPGVFIGKTKRGITIKKGGIKKHEAQLLNLKNISILAQGVTISSNVVEYCAEKGIPIDFVGFNGRPYAKIYTFQYSSASIGVAQLKAYENDIACILAKCFVSGKIRNQINLTKYYYKYRKGRDKDYTAIFDEKITSMNLLLKELSNLHEKDLEILRGKLFSIEGRAGNCYWEIVEELLNEYIEFEGRVRKNANDLVNSLLNYGYGILYSRIWEAIIKVGLNPYLSYLHKPQHGKPTLVFDMIEEFRQQAVDRPVFSLITKGEKLEIKGGLLTYETRKKVAEKVLERIHTVENFRGEEIRLSQIIKKQAKALAEFIEGKIVHYRPYIGKW
ncbi:MAG TPA: CRISPR-associated endonuclease Cas1 [Syntrophorhabdaceae bacterium]|nr:CRISPR-associated endonuclease Cas1 [Syntrophorhabdaceae bacterium]